MDSTVKTTSQMIKKKYSKSRKQVRQRGKYQKLSLVDKEKLYEQVIKQNIPIVQTAKNLNINLSTARLIIKNYQESNQFNSLKNAKLEPGFFPLFHQKVITLDYNYFMTETKKQIKFESYEKSQPTFSTQNIANNHQLINKSCFSQTINNIQINNIMLMGSLQLLDPSLIQKLELVKKSIQISNQK